MSLEKQLRDSIKAASGSIGKIIKMGGKMTSQKGCHYLENKIVLFVSAKLTGMPYRVIKAYSLLLAAARQVEVYTMI